MTTTTTAPSRKAEAMAALTVAQAEFFGTGRIVALKTEKSMGTITAWSVEPFPRREVGTDTSCVCCGLQTCRFGGAR